MPDSFDAATRLAQGWPAVDTVAEYVVACRLLGYHHQDLTSHPGQVHDWYDTEDGLDLRALESEHAALAAAAASAEQALQVQEDQLRALSEGWQGGGAQASRAFLLRHGAESARVAAALRAAAETIAELRDTLWRAVDGKVAAAVEIEGRRAAQRGDWLAAARAVSTGAGDRAAASELIDQQVKPFVAGDIGGQWLTAMRAGTAEVSDAYEAAVAGLQARGGAVFDIPGGLGPSWSPGRDMSAVAPAGPPAGAGSSVTGTAGVMPGCPPGGPSWPAPAPLGPASMPMSPMSMSAPLMDSPVPATAPAVGAPALDTPPAMGSPLGGGLPGAGAGAGLSGLSGLGSQLWDLFGGLIGSAAGGLPDGMGDGSADFGPDELLDEPDEVDELGKSEASDTEDDEDDSVDEETEGTAAEEDTADENAADLFDPANDPAEMPEPQPAPSEPISTPSPTSALVEPVPPPAAEPLAAPAGETPCDIAADELPQVGP